MRRNSKICEIWHFFHNLAYMSGINLIESSWKFHERVPLNFGCHRDIKIHTPNQDCELSPDYRLGGGLHSTSTFVYLVRFWILQTYFIIHYCCVTEVLPHNFLLQYITHRTITSGQIEGAAEIADYASALCHMVNQRVANFTTRLVHKNELKM